MSSIMSHNSGHGGLHRSEKRSVISGELPVLWHLVSALFICNIHHVGAILTISLPDASFLRHLTLLMIMSLYMSRIRFPPNYKNLGSIFYFFHLKLKRQQRSSISWTWPARHYDQRQQWRCLWRDGSWSARRLGCELVLQRPNISQYIL